MNSFVENVRKKLEAKSKGPKDPNKKTRSKRSKKKVVEQGEDSEPGTIFLSHIPHGFYEKQLEKYFSQFGKVLKVRLARSKKSGRPKGFAYIKFLRSAVAKIVAESMNNYLFFERILKCEFIPADKLHPDTFKPTLTEEVLSSDLHRKKVNGKKSEESLVKSKVRKLDRLLKLKKSLKEKGIQFKVKPFATNDD